MSISIKSNLLFNNSHQNRYLIINLYYNKFKSRFKEFYILRIKEVTKKHFYNKKILLKKEY